MCKKEPRTICEGATSNWSSLSRGRGSRQTGRASGDLGDGVHDGGRMGDDGLRVRFGGDGVWVRK